MTVNIAKKPCTKCGDYGWLWWHELDEYDGPAVESGIDDTRYPCDRCNLREIVAAAEAALASTLPAASGAEPVAWRYQDSRGNYWYRDDNDGGPFEPLEPLYASPVALQPQEIQAVAVSIELPPLPCHVGEESHGPSQSPVKLYDGDQMREYARAALVLAHDAAHGHRCNAGTERRQPET